MPAPTPSLHHSVLDELGSQIVRGELAPGTTFSADERAERRGVSRSVMREAVRVLETLGLVTSRRRAGTRVQPPECWNALDTRVVAWGLDGPDRRRQLHQLSELRLGVEPLAARLAAANATEEQRRTLTEAGDALSTHSRAADQSAYLAADTAFHRSLLAASGNRMLAQLGDLVAEVLAGRTRNALMPREADSTAVRLHRAVAAAVASGDADAAEAAMRAIVEESDRAVQES
ncbi:GntR family transcriptional regulator [Rathayibacter sp. AY1E8]|jgi:DNA-binding FadR family transcriptional regulator|uniref:FadR/GntR family transcriptional regulator n=1 Tax=unclassified Rathayibacter TaxID=2609250 RepID=UPI000CE862AC|nr:MULTISPECIES: FCD domain-containing protein [unclassified Rathayibacter]PPF35921.1 GntR family transcriptional regulator [Rathayibacter sp. AY1A3]PPG19708.1 GntR family transcriptional regulator [Rathayibacter sp. AY1E8]PPH01586.1 GntR family transcriptional regulator [Rathayibacter sp. AY1F6]PPI03008.1 GntR family transcriptional regulator [Rathayibacter sp. AY1D1]